MMQSHYRRSYALIVAVLLMMSYATASYSQDEKKKKKKEVPQGTAVLWREPSDIESRSSPWSRWREDETRSQPHHVY